MSLQTWSEKYALAAAIVLLFLVLLDNSLALLIVSAFGLAAGLLITWRSSLKRAGAVALVGFAVAAALAAFKLLK